jgi:hypothetical protein
MLSSEWKKSSRSSQSGGQCVEARYLTNEWRKASRSDQSGGNCVEARAIDSVVQVRDTKLGEDSPILDVAPRDWLALLAVREA